MNRYWIVSVFVFLFACESNSSDKFIHYNKYLENEFKLLKTDLDDKASIYIINLSSCSGCIELNLNYLKKQCEQLEIDLVFIGNYQGTIWESEIGELMKCYKVYFDKDNSVAKYNISTSKPLLINFDIDGDIKNTQNIGDQEIYSLMDKIKL